jgi:hypothetical protein
MRRIPLALLFAAVIIGFAVIVQITLQGPRTIPYYTSGNLTFADVGYAVTSYYGDIVITTNSTANATLYFASAVFVIPKSEFRYNTTYRTVVKEGGSAFTYELYFDNVYGYGSIIRKSPIPVLYKAIKVEIGNYYLFYPVTYNLGDIVVCPYPSTNYVFAVLNFRLLYDPSASATYRNPVLYWDLSQLKCYGAISSITNTEVVPFNYIRTTLSPGTPYTYKSSMTMNVNPTVYGQPYIMITAQAKAPTQITIEFK